VFWRISEFACDKQPDVMVEFFRQRLMILRAID
jgi:hypothetical protein